MVANISMIYSVSSPAQARLLLPQSRGGLFLMAVTGAPQSLIVPPILGSPSSLVSVFVTNLSSKNIRVIRIRYKFASMKVRYHS